MHSGIWTCRHVSLYTPGPRHFLCPRPFELHLQGFVAIIDVLLCHGVAIPLSESPVHNLCLLYKVVFERWWCLMDTIEELAVVGFVFLVQPIGPDSCIGDAMDWPIPLLVGEANVKTFSLATTIIQRPRIAHTCNSGRHAKGF